MQKVRDALGDEVDYRRVEVVGPSVSSELLAYGTIGLVLAIGAILIYLWFRFEWQFALGAMIANVHDLVLTVGFMSLTQIDFDLTSIAALLTILGYSLNDTVVIYDRIREMLRRYKRMSMPDLLNVSINATLSRSIVTHLTVAISLLGAAAVRRPGDPQLHRDHDVRRRAGRHLYVGVHRFADPDLSRRRHQPHGRRVPRSPSRRAPQAAATPATAREDAPLVEAPHLPRQALIDAHGGGGFRFAGMSHRGSLAVPAGRHLGVAGGGARRIDGRIAVAGVCPRRAISTFSSWAPALRPGSCPKPLRARFRDAHISADAMTTGPAVRTYNVMLMENRRVGAGLIAIE